MSNLVLVFLKKARRLYKIHLNKLYITFNFLTFGKYSSVNVIYEMVTPLKTPTHDNIPGTKNDPLKTTPKKTDFLSNFKLAVVMKI